MLASAFPFPKRPVLAVVANMIINHSQLSTDFLKKRRENGRLKKEQTPRSSQMAQIVGHHKHSWLAPLSTPECFRGTYDNDRQDEDEYGDKDGDEVGSKMKPREEED